MLDLCQQRVCVTGGAGFLGQRVCARLRAIGVPPERIFVPRRRDYDLTVEGEVKRLYETFQPTVVIHLAAEVGGIGANRLHPGRFFFANMAMGLHLIEQARYHKLVKFIHTGTVCAYPKLTPVPFKEADLWNGYPEETNAPYAVAKKALFVMLDGYKREYGLDSAIVVPVNLYGPGDNFDLQSSHVIPALIRKCTAARQRGDERITCWGSGSPSREFLYVDDAADGVIRAAQRIDTPDPINLGTGCEITIKDLVDLIVRLTGFAGSVEWDSTKPDGQPRRSLDTTRARELLDWHAATDFEQGLAETVRWWLEEGCEQAGGGHGEDSDHAHQKRRRHHHGPAAHHAGADGSSDGVW